MTNNDILRRIRYTFNFRDPEVGSIFAMADCQVTREQVGNWLRKSEDPAFLELSDTELATFLNGLIIDRRGKREGPKPAPEAVLNNNIILRKLRIALDLKAEDILEILSFSSFCISKHELSALFRKPGNKHYRECKDQILRNFLNGMTAKYRVNAKSQPDKEPSTDESQPGKEPSTDESQPDKELSADESCPDTEQE